MKQSITFWLDGTRYDAPTRWFEARMKARKAVGMDANEAAISTMQIWANLQEKRTT